MDGRGQQQVPQVEFREPPEQPDEDMPTEPVDLSRLEAHAREKGWLR